MKHILNYYIENEKSVQNLLKTLTVCFCPVVSPSGLNSIFTSPDFTVLIKTSIKSPTYNKGQTLFKLSTSTIYSHVAPLQMKQNKQSAPYWRLSLTNLCRMVSSLRQEAWSAEEQEDGELTEGSLRLLEELYSLQHICRALQSREERVRLNAKEKSQVLISCCSSYSVSSSYFFSCL